MLQTALEPAYKSQARQHRHGQADVVHDVQPEMGKVGGAGDETVDALRLGDGGEDGHQRLDSRILEDQKPHPAVPEQAVDGLGGGVGLLTPATAAAAMVRLLRHLERGEEDLALGVGRRDELAHHEEEVAEREGLRAVEPRVDVDVGVGEGDLEEAAYGEDRQVAADAHDGQLLVGPGQVRGVPEHEDEEAEEREDGTGSGDDLVDGEEVETAGEGGCLRVGQWPWHLADLAVGAGVIPWVWVVVFGSPPC